MALDNLSQIIAAAGARRSQLIAEFSQLQRAIFEQRRDELVRRAEAERAAREIRKKEEKAAKKNRNIAIGTVVASAVTGGIAGTTSGAAAPTAAGVGEVGSALAGPPASLAASAPVGAGTVLAAGAGNVVKNTFGQGLANFGRGAIAGGLQGSGLGSILPAGALGKISDAFKPALPSAGQFPQQANKVLDLSNEQIDFILKQLKVRRAENDRDEGLRNLGNIGG